MIIMFQYVVADTYLHIYTHTYILICICRPKHSVRCFRHRHIQSMLTHTTKHTWLGTVWCRTMSCSALLGYITASDSCFVILILCCQIAWLFNNSRNGLQLCLSEWMYIRRKVTYAHTKHAPTYNIERRACAHPGESIICPTAAFRSACYRVLGQACP